MVQLIICWADDGKWKQVREWAEQARCRADKKWEKVCEWMRQSGDEEKG